MKKETKRLSLQERVRYIRVFVQVRISPKELCQTVTEHVEVFLCFLSLMLDCGIFQINEIKRHLLV